MKSDEIGIQIWVVCLATADCPAHALTRNSIEKGKRYEICAYSPTLCSHDLSPGESCGAQCSTMLKILAEFL